MKTKSITSVTLILIGNMLTTYSSIGSGWTASVTALFGLILFFIGLTRLKSVLDEKGRRGINNIVWAAILGLISSAISYIPIVGIVPAGILNIIAFILQLIGLLKLRKSETLGTTGASGVNFLLAAIVIMIIAGIFNIIPFAGGYIKPVIAFFAFILIPFGWLKIQEAIINNLMAVPNQSISNPPEPGNTENVAHPVVSEINTVEKSNEPQQEPISSETTNWIGSWGKWVILGTVAVAVFFGVYWFLIKPTKGSANNEISTSNNPNSSSSNSQAITSSHPTEENIRQILQGKWAGTIGNKSLSFHLVKVGGGKIEGFDIAGTNQRPFTGSYTWHKTQDILNHAFSISLQEPGDNKYDGVFKLEGGAYSDKWSMSGSWHQFKGTLNETVTVTKTAEDDKNSDAFRSEYYIYNNQKNGENIYPWFIGKWLSSNMSLEITATGQTSYKVKLCFEDGCEDYKGTLEGRSNLPYSNSIKCTGPRGQFVIKQSDPICITGYLDAVYCKK